MKLYKLTDHNGETQNNTKWGKGITHEVKPCKNPRLCSSDVLHAYKNLNLAYLLNPIHASISHPIAWEAKGKIVVEDWGKVGCFKLTITKQIGSPAWGEKGNLVQLLFAILCAEEVLPIYKIQYPNDDRPYKAIKAAKEYLKNPTYAAKAANAAYAAANAANAAYAAYAAKAAYAAAKAANAAYAAAYAAKAANAANAAAYGKKKIDFCALADQAVKEVIG